MRALSGASFEESLRFSMIGSHRIDFVYMTRVLLLLLSLVALQSLRHANGSTAALYSVHAKALQSNQQLTLDQIRRLLEANHPDENIARDIRRLGLAFRPNGKTREDLRKLGAGDFTIEAILEAEARAAYEVYVNERQDARRLKLGKEFLLEYPRSEHVKDVVAGNLKASQAIFNAEFQSFSRSPNAASLDQLLAHGREILDQRPENSVVVEVTTQLAVATARGMLGNFYSDLEKSREYANQALKLLQETPSQSVAEPEANNKLRAASLSLLLQVQGLYLLRQAEPDPEQALVFLNRAVEKEGPSATDPVTYWLRTLAADLIYQKLRDEYQALTKSQRLGARGEALCAKIAPLTRQIIGDYAQVIGLSGAAKTRELHDEAVAALTSFSTSDRPCLAGRRELIDEWPEAEKRFAVVIGVEEYQDKRISRFNYAAADARMISEALVQSGGFPREQVILLAAGESVEQQPTRSSILRNLAGLRGRATQEGLLLVVFVGHAIERGGKAYVLPSDAQAGDAVLLQETAISVDRVKELIRASEAGQVMLIFDSFRQQPIAGVASPDNPLTENFTREMALDTGKGEVMAFAALFASSVGERAYESQTKKQGYFPAGLVEALKGRAANSKREVTLSGLIKYLQTTVPLEAQRELGQNAQQQPRGVTEGYQADEVVLASTGSSASARTGKPEPGELLRAAKTIFIRPRTIYLRDGLLNEELRKHPDFNSLGLTFSKNEKEADLVVAVTLPFMSWTWNYTVTHVKTNTLLAKGSVGGVTAGAAAPKLAAALVASLQSLRKE